jgi:hypothetical protein
MGADGEIETRADRECDAVAPTDAEPLNVIAGVLLSDWVTDDVAESESETDIDIFADALVEAQTEAVGLIAEKVGDADLECECCPEKEFKVAVKRGETEALRLTAAFVCETSGDRLDEAVIFKRVLDAAIVKVTVREVSADGDGLSEPDGELDRLGLFDTEDRDVALALDVSDNLGDRDALTEPVLLLVLGGVAEAALVFDDDGDMDTAATVSEGVCDIERHAVVERLGEAVIEADEDGLFVALLEGDSRGEEETEPVRLCVEVAANEACADRLGISEKELSCDTDTRGDLDSDELLESESETLPDTEKETDAASEPDCVLDGITVIVSRAVAEWLPDMSNEADETIVFVSDDEGRVVTDASADIAGVRDRGSCDVVPHAEFESDSGFDSETLPLEEADMLGDFDVLAEEDIDLDDVRYVFEAVPGVTVNVFDMYVTDDTGELLLEFAPPGDDDRSGDLVDDADKEEFVVALIDGRSDLEADGDLESELLTKPVREPEGDRESLRDGFGDLDGDVERTFEVETLGDLDSDAAMESECEGLIDLNVSVGSIDDNALSDDVSEAFNEIDLAGVMLERDDALGSTLTEVAIEVVPDEDASFDSVRDAAVDTDAALESDDLPDADDERFGDGDRGGVNDAIEDTEALADRERDTCEVELSDCR